MESNINKISAVEFEGPGSDNSRAFRWYGENKIVGGKALKDHLRFAGAYWHSFCGTGADPFGESTHLFAWDKFADPIDRAKMKMDHAFDFLEKLSIPFYCFHDTDLVDYTIDLNENERRLAVITDYAKQKHKVTGVKLLWGTANLFSKRRYMNGAATNPDFRVVAHAVPR